MKKEYTPYYFDMKVEYNIYFKIGQTYRNQFRRKKIKKNKRYPDFDKYMEWRDYFISKFSTAAVNDCNFMRYLNRILRVYQLKLEIYKSVAIPIYISEVTIFMTIYAANNYPIHSLIDTTLFVLFLTLTIGIYAIIRFSRRAQFIEDCINVIENNYLTTK